MTDRSREVGEQPGTTRRAVILGVGAAGAAGLLAACGGDETPSGGSNRGNGQPPANQTPTEIPLADIPVGGGKYYQSEHVIITRPTENEVKAFDATCTHMGCTVGHVGDGLMTCECHGSQFRITDGSVAKGPDTGQPLSRGLATRRVTVTGDTITIS
jgi:Rieske Fe-S protein